ncbi:MAG: DUF481 domain-containing protein [Longimicrobiales bacterium]|nr:DUF481 domain-containing protein [Longimicrobiales bacterium]
MACSVTRYRLHLRLLPLLAGVLLVAISPPRLLAQEEKPWSLEGEVGASVFFGAASQTAILFRSAYTRKTDQLELGLTGGFDYGQSEDDDGNTFVNKRDWTLGGELDHQAGRWSPFLFVTGEGSLKRQVDLRLSGGGGTRYFLVRNDRTRFDVSVALLAEFTDPRVPEGEPDESNTLARWSNRARFSHTFIEGRAEYSLVTFYQPAFQDVGGDYTVDVETALTFALNGSISFKVSLIDKYDSLAKDRGATSNNDGRLFFSILAKR